MFSLIHLTTPRSGLKSFLAIMTLIHMVKLFVYFLVVYLSLWVGVQNDIYKYTKTQKSYTFIIRSISQR